MSELSDTIQESVEQADKNKTNARVAVMVAITATFMALCNVKDGNIVQSMAQAQAHGIDSWSYFQAKSTKQSQAENTLELMRLQQPADSQALVHRYQNQIQRYETEKAAIKKEALNYQKQYDDLNVFDDQFDMTEALLSISIALFGITALTHKRWLFYFSVGVSVLGIILGVTAFMGISLHSDFVARILG